MPYWAVYLIVATIIMVAGIICRDTRALWIGAIWAAGILAMQGIRLIGEPDQWWAAAALWSGLAMVSLAHREVTFEAAFLWTIPVGYLLLVVHHTNHAPGAGGMETIGFAITEIGAIAAGAAGGRRIFYAGVRNLGLGVRRVRRSVGADRAANRPVHR